MLSGVTGLFFVMLLVITDRHINQLAASYTSRELRNE